MSAIWRQLTPGLFICATGGCCIVSSSTFGSVSDSSTFVVLKFNDNIDECKLLVMFSTTLCIKYIRGHKEKKSVSSRKRIRAFPNRDLCRSAHTPLSYETSHQIGTVTFPSSHENI